MSTKNSNPPPTPAEQLIAQLHDEALSASKSKSILSRVFMLHVTDLDFIERTDVEAISTDTQLLFLRILNLLDYAESRMVV